MEHDGRVVSFTTVLALPRDSQRCGLHSREESPAVRGWGGGLAQPAYLGADSGPAGAVCPHSYR